MRLRLRNTGSQRRLLSVFSYLHFVLGVLPGESPFLSAHIAGNGRAVLARNPAAGEYGDRVAVAAVVPLGRAPVTATANRASFLGPGGDLAAPRALRSTPPLDGGSGVGLDACAAFRVSLELRPGEAAGCDFLLGEGLGEADARDLWSRYGNAEAIDVAFGAAVALAACHRQPSCDPKERVKLDFTLKDLNGRDVNLASYRGKPLLINFWATWCGPCKEEIPSMIKLNKAMAGKNFRMLAIAIDEGGKDAVQKFFKGSKDLPAYLDPDGKVSQLYGTTGVPETFFIDEQGIVREVVIQPLNEQQMSASIDRLLAD